MGQTLLRIEGIKKYFPGTRALDFGSSDAIDVYSGEVHALLGENGAGKSTLSKILSGIYVPDGGQLFIKGQRYAPRDIYFAWQSGIAMVLQEPGLVSTLSVADNFFIRREKAYLRYGIINPRRRFTLCKQALEAAGIFDVKPGDLAGSLTLEQQKLVELARALSIEPDVLIIDETSAALSVKSVKLLVEHLRAFKNNGGSVVFISHHLDEIFSYCDRVSVLKDGKLVQTLAVSDTSPEKITTLMVGREIDTTFRRRSRSATRGEVVLRAEELGYAEKLRSVGFDLHRGEILGIGGLTGAGGDELARIVAGDLRPTSGTIWLTGERQEIVSPRAAQKLGIAYVPKNRDEEGAVLQLSVRHNMGLSVLRSLTRYLVLRVREEKQIVQSMVDRLRVKCSGLHSTLLSLSGGNRQKVVLGKCLAVKPRMLVLNCPTRGVDVGAKAEIYRLMEMLCDQGMAILLVSDEIPELIGMCDQILILRNGAVSGAFSRNEGYSEQALVAAML